MSCAATSAFYVTTKPRARRAKSLRTHTSNSLWNTVRRSLGDSFGVSLAPHQQSEDDTTDDQHDLRDIINRETLDPSSDYHTWKGILAPSFSSLAPTQRSRVLEMACLHIADIEAEADHLQHVLCVQERGGERGGEAGGTRKDVRRSIGRVSFAFCFVSLRSRSAFSHCVCQRLRAGLVC